ncbi:bifunctional diguanylate cyclase/phosphodiesterase [uncultured Psychromonas sp.]|uniref:putative bifunctional diguanylate cyclase/phosphodiesterase n=1 Tax=uncultured Psychromonas sp. TaxID=173974 RepID=UPI00262494AF|nr:bifunctional diguanylate cyclase/phosphodiesterase [uncultured Psychromonas sp.]
MNIAMHIMSIQHQLVLAIDKDPDLKKMLHQFLSLCSLSLNSTNSHIFLIKDNNNNPTYQLDINHEIQLKHYVSFPMKKNGLLSSEDTKLSSLVNHFFKNNRDQQEQNFGSTLYHFFKIGDFGVLTIEREKSLDPAIQNALPPVLNKLAISTIAAINYHSLVIEIKTRQRVEEKISYQASHDFLTGLYNRMKIQEFLASAIDDCIHQEQTGAILLINLTGFKNINDVMGYHVGDEVLKQAAVRLKVLIKNMGIVARFNGHEFIILLRSLPVDKSTVQSIVNDVIADIINAMEIPFEFIEGRFSLSCFIGYETFNNASKGVQDILKNASIAVYEAFKRGKDKALPYNEMMSKQLNDHISYTREIKQALAHDEFELHYQPQYDHLNNMIGAEALLRWNNPLRGYESPAIYIPIAEESDLIMQISSYVLQQACEDIKKLQQLPLPSSFKQVSINISAKQLAKHDFADTIISAIKENQISPEHLKIEITESMMMGDIELSIACLEKLHLFGVECAIDDFGTGYSSLAYLKRLPASLLKIDRSFITDINADISNLAIVSMIIELAKSVNMQVIAEGVETKQELASLVALGCYQYQGFYFSRPLTFNKLVECFEP